jgi:hypothetical protein
MPSIFDLTYYGLAVIMLGLLGSTILAGMSLRGTVASPLARREALGVSLAAGGALLTLVGGVAFLILLRDGLLTGVYYQEVQFSVFYVAFALFLYGILATARRWPAPAWLGFVATLVLASVFLFNPSSYSYAHSGSRIIAAQQMVFWAQLFYVTVVRALLAPWRATRGVWHPLWFAVCCAALLIRRSASPPSSPAWAIQSWTSLQRSPLPPGQRLPVHDHAHAGGGERVEAAMRQC